VGNFQTISTPISYPNPAFPTHFLFLVRCVVRAQNCTGFSRSFSLFFLQTTKNENERSKKQKAYTLLPFSSDDGDLRS
jgi:hypothetical protein